MYSKLVKTVSQSYIYDITFIHLYYYLRSAASFSKIKWTTCKRSIMESKVHIKALYSRPISQTVFMSSIAISETWMCYHNY